jgi:hypothetical protein
MLTHRVAAIAGAGLAASLAAGSPAGTLNFRNVTLQRITQAVPEVPSNEKAVDAGDFDNDGDLDVVIANAYSDFGARRNKLYRNDGGAFLEISGPPAIPGFDTPDVTRGAFLRDYDADGWLDIAVVNDGNSGPSKLYLNVHAGGIFDHFELVGAMHFPSSSGGATNAAVSEDFDMANGFDLFFANGPSSTQNRLWLNDGLGTFFDVTATNVPVLSPGYTVDAAAGDLNGDGSLDLLLACWNSDGRIYYNDLDGTDSSGPGDFEYLPSGVQVLAEASADQNSLEPGDFDGDGRQDIYWSDATGIAEDRVLRNAGNDPSGKAAFELLPLDVLPPSVTARASRRATVADLNDDGRLDLVVMHESPPDSRPSVLRNVTVNGAIAFLDWTPARAFPSGDAHRGRHAAVFDSDGDGGLDVFLGGWAGDHLFVRAEPDAIDEDDLGDKPLPPIFNRDAFAIHGASGPSDVDAYFTSDIATGIIAAVLTGPDDYRLEIQTAAHVVLGESNRGGLGVEEALQVGFSATALKIVIQVLGCAGPEPDLDGDCTIGVVDLLGLLAAWGPNPGHPADADGSGTVDVLDFLGLLAAWGPVLHDYVLELVSRD